MAKKKSTAFKSFDEVDQALLTLGQKEAFIQHEEAILNDTIQQLRDNYEKSTSDARAIKTQMESDIESFCIEHKEEFEKKRSMDLVHGTVSFRTSPPKVAQLNRKYSWATILELVKKFPWAKDYKRVQEEVNKEAILADYAAKKITDEKLATIGAKIDQKEDFGIEIKWDSLNN